MTLVTALTLLMAVSANDAHKILHCTGFNGSSVVEHYVDLTLWRVDDRAYMLYEGTSTYTLEGPVGVWQPTDPKPPHMLVIDRITGQFWMANDGHIRPDEWTRPSDPGCVAVTPKF